MSQVTGYVLPVSHRIRNIRDHQHERGAKTPAQREQHHDVADPPMLVLHHHGHGGSVVDVRGVGVVDGGGVVEDGEDTDRKAGSDDG